MMAAVAQVKNALQWLWGKGMMPERGRHYRDDVRTISETSAGLCHRSVKLKRVQCRAHLWLRE